MSDDKSHAILDAHSIEECIIEQNWSAYSDEDHNTWRTLFTRQVETLRGLACEDFFEGLARLRLTAEQVPDYRELNVHLRAATGWEVVAVPGLIAAEPFFQMLASKKFPAGTFIRTPAQLDYLEEPDIFHDVFGHVPLLSDPAYASYMQAYGHAGLEAAKHKGTKFLARLNWYTIEFGLIKSDAGVRAYGAGIMSSYGEARYVRDDPSAHFVQFDLDRVMRTGYYIDDFQATYFVIDSFDALSRGCRARPFVPLYEQCRAQPALTPFTLEPDDVVLRRGTEAYWKSFPELKVKLK
jgi:phenylalanine-4-hydroxylase